MKIQAIKGTLTKLTSGYNKIVIKSPSIRHRDGLSTDKVLL